MSMQVSPKMAIMSHLSDAQELINMNCSESSINYQINVAKSNTAGVLYRCRNSCGRRYNR